MGQASVSFDPCCRLSVRTFLDLRYGALLMHFELVTACKTAIKVETYRHHRLITNCPFLRLQNGASAEPFELICGYAVTVASDVYRSFGQRKQRKLENWPLASVSLAQFVGRVRWNVRFTNAVVT